MAQTAANLASHVLPIAPVRQFVITLPFELRDNGPRVFHPLSHLNFKSQVLRRKLGELN
jgi:hypothetical protein